jgi:hypothetical protein
MSMSAATLSVLVALAGAAEMPVEGETPAVPEVLQSPWVSGMFWFGLVFLLVVIALSAYLLLNRLRNQREAQRAADALFESRMIALAHASVEPGVGEGEPAPKTPPAVPANMIGNVPQTDDAADILCADILQRLSAAGMLVRVGEYVELHGNRKGAVMLELAGQRTALLLPHFESEGFVHHNLRRYDFLILVSSGGRAVIVNTLEEAIAQRFSP